MIQRWIIPFKEKRVEFHIVLKSLKFTKMSIVILYNGIYYICTNQKIKWEIFLGF